MKCEEVEGRLAEVLAGERGQDAAVEGHLLGCASCRRDFESAQAGWSAAARLPAPSPSRHLVERVRRKVESTEARGFKFATAAAAAVLVGLLAFQAVTPPARRATIDPPPLSRTAPVLASFESEAGLGSLVARDLEGRPVGDLEIARHCVQVEILDGIAKTTIEEAFLNRTPRRLEGTFYFPLPPEASISRLAMEINGKLMEGAVVERQYAREVYEGIVRRMQDPALLEWMPGGIFKCRIFPIEPHSEKRIILSYTQALPCMAGKMKYVYPLASEKARENSLAYVSIDVATRFAAKVASIRCPSHSIDLVKKDEHEAQGRFEARDLRPTNDFVLDLELQGGEELALLPHKVDGEDGTFLAAYTPPGVARRVPPNRVAIVLDISASVSKPELDAMRQVVESLLDRIGPDFVLLAHHVEVVRFAGPKREAIDWLGRLETAGACDLRAGLEAAVAEKPGEIVYIGEGVPSMGDEKFDLRFEGTLRTVAVGSDASRTILDDLARKHRGVSFAISPSDHVRSRVREIADGLVSEIVRDVAVEATQEIYDLAPAGRRNLLAGERLIVTGRWRGSAATLSIGGRDFQLTFPAKEERNNYVRRLWAQRKIADLLGDESKKAEVIALSTQYGIMTPYTSFLVLETEEEYKKYSIERKSDVQDRLMGYRNGIEEKENSESETKKPPRGDLGSYDSVEELGWTHRLRIQGTQETISGERSRLRPLNSELLVLTRNFDGYLDFEYGEKHLGQRLPPAAIARIKEVGPQPSTVTLEAGANRGVRPGMLFAVLREGRFLAVIAVRSVAENTAVATVWQGLALGPMRAGDQVHGIGDIASYLHSLPREVRLELASLRTIERIVRLLEEEREAGERP